MDAHEQVGGELVGDLDALAQRQRPVARVRVSVDVDAVSRSCAATWLRDREGQLLLAEPGTALARPRFEPPWPGSRTTTGRRGAARSGTRQALASVTSERPEPHTWRFSRIMPGQFAVFGVALTQTVQKATFFRLSVAAPTGGVAPVTSSCVVAFLEVAINRIAGRARCCGVRSHRATPPDVAHRRSTTAGCSCSTSPGRSRVRRPCSRLALRFVRGTGATRSRQSRSRRPACSPRSRSCSPLPPTLSFALEIAFASRSCSLVASALGSDRDLGMQIGLVVARRAAARAHAERDRRASILWPDGAFDGAGRDRRSAPACWRCASPRCVAVRVRAAAVRACGDAPGPVAVRDGDRGDRRDRRAHVVRDGREGRDARDRRRADHGAGRSAARALPARDRDAGVDARVVRDSRRATRAGRSASASRSSCSAATASAGRITTCCRCSGSR